MQIGIVRVGVPQRLVPMPVRVGLRHRPVVMMPVVLIMDVGVLVFHRLMNMLVLVPLCEVQP